MADEAPLRLASIVGIDVAGYSARTEADSTATARQVVAMRTRIADVAAKHRGRIFNTAGDGVMLEFSSASDAVEAIYDLLDDRPAREPEAHIGAHLGDVTTTENGDLLGHGVNVAARLMALAPAGRAVISQDLKAAAGSHASREMRALGEVALAKMHAKVFVFEIAPDTGAKVARKLSWGGRAAALAAAGALALIVIAGGVFMMRRPAGSPVPAATAEASANAPAISAQGVGLAVVPFTNLSSDPEQEHFVDGLTEELLNWLGNVEGLRVPGRTSSFQFKGEAQDLRAIGETLNVDYLLEGSVRRSGDALRITAQLIEARTGYHIWSQTYDRKLADIFAIQDEIARLVVTELLGKIPESGAANPAAVGDVDPRAHELYLEGRALWTERRSGPAFKKFREAVEVDPRHALAQAYLAVVAAHAAANEYALPEAPDPSAIATNALAAAVRLKPQAADVLFAQGWVAEMSDGDPGRNLDAASIDLYERALRANPRHVEALHALARGAKSDEEEIALYQRVLEIDPAHLSARNNLIRSYVARGERARAASLARQALTATRDTGRNSAAWAGRSLGDMALTGEALFADQDPTGRDYMANWFRASTLVNLGAIDEARFLYALEIEKVEAPDWRQMARINVAVLEGNSGAGLAAAEEMHRLDQPPPWSSWTLASALIRSGDPQKAYDVIIARRPDLAGGKPQAAGPLPGCDMTDPELLTAAHALALLGRSDEARALWRTMVDAGAEPTWRPVTWGDHLTLSLLNANLGDDAAAVRGFKAAYETGFRYPWTYDCFDVVLDGFSSESGLFSAVLAIPENAALMEKIKAENAQTLAQFNKQYGVLDKVRAMMAAKKAE